MLSLASSNDYPHVYLKFSDCLKSSWLKPNPYFIAFPDLKVGVIINPTLQSGEMKRRELALAMT